MITNFSIVKGILEEEIGKNNLSIFEIFKLSRKNNLKDYYIGDKVSFDHQLETVKDSNDNIVCGVITKSKSKSNPSLFKFNEDDSYYYDILEDNKRCRMVTDEVTVGKNLCKNMCSLDAKVKKIRWKLGI